MHSGPVSGQQVRAALLQLDVFHSRRSACHGSSADSPAAPHALSRSHADSASLERQASGAQLKVHVLDEERKRKLSEKHELARRETERMLSSAKASAEALRKAACDNNTSDLLHLLQHNHDPFAPVLP